MNLKQLEYFIAIADGGSISAAARSLHISQPPLSTQMHLLEDELGQSLFDRGPRSIRLTEAGRLFYERAQNILDMAAAAKKDLEQLGQGAAGVLRLGMISSVQTEPIIACIAGFRQKYPGALFRIYEGNTYQLLEKLSGGQIQAAIVRTPFPEDGLDCHYLLREPMMAVGSSRFLGDTDEPIPLDELRGLPLVIYRRWENVLSQRFHPAVTDYLCICDDARSCLAWAKAQAGVSIVPASITLEGIGRLRARRIDCPGLDSAITLVTLKNAGLSFLGQQFIQSFHLPAAWGVRS